MKVVQEPQIFLVGKTELAPGGLAAYLDAIGITEDDWFPDPRVSGAENLIEAGGRMCYRSWAPWDPAKPEGTNPNVTKVREGNNVYLANVVRSEHGALFEHANATFIFKDVSRVFTHELVRHRAGWAYSQESLRYVRLNDLRFWIPQMVKDQEGGVALFEETIRLLEQVQQNLFHLFKIDKIANFATKKLMTSMFRRLAPIGLATSIMATGNLRAWRHVIGLRTSTHAEEEIRLVFDKVARMLKAEYPHAFFDMQCNDAGEWVCEHPKI
ncbi:FAD-dependent thymidylate synthase [Patescibacteria group bacterium]|nr:FAD-dependent thymidylate synthase [Patescibacteria group bacterium]